MAKGFTTKILHTPYPLKDAYGALHMPVYDGVAFEFSSAESMEEAFSGRKFAHAYSRTTNPTVEYFEKKMMAATQAHAALAFSSGMAAISSAVLSLVEPGGKVLSSNHLFGHTYAFFKKTLPSLGIEVKFVNLSDPSEVERVMDGKTRVLFFETITNPQLEIVDIMALSSICQRHGVVLMADSSTTPPNVFQSKALGVHVEVMSTTKFISGGATTFGGVVLDNGNFDWSGLPSMRDWQTRFGKDALIARLRKEIFRHFGGAMTPHTAHFMNLGLDVLSLRVDKCVDNCLKLSSFLMGNHQIKSVNYPGMKGHPGYELARKQFSGKPGAILTFDLESPEACFQFANRLKVIRRATNLNDNKTLIIHPYSTIYSEFTENEKTNMGIRNTTLRLSVGIEDADDLMADIEQALQ